MNEDIIVLDARMYTSEDWLHRQEIIGESFVDSKKAYHIAMCASTDYIKWIGILMESIMMKNFWLRKSLVFHLLVDDVAEEDKEKLKRFSEKWNVAIVLYFMNDKNMDGFTHFSLTTKNGKILYSYFYRWLIPYVVDKNIEKVLYLDADSVCNRDISEILIEEFEEPLLAVLDNNVFREINAKRLKLKSENYFCGGFTYLNIRRLKQDHVIEKILQYLSDCVKNHIDLPLTEQDAANLVLEGKVKIADDSYHYSILLENKEVEKKNVQDGIENAYFIHFMGKVKPWHIEAQDYSVGKVWEAAKLHSEWKDAPLVVTWDRERYRVAARGAKMSGNYLKWVEYKLKFGLYHFKK